jgi:hypothetical protein
MVIVHTKSESRPPLGSVQSKHETFSGKLSNRYYPLSSNELVMEGLDTPSH